MKKLNFLLIASFLILFTNCNKEEDLETVFTMADFAGSWITISTLHTNNANPSESVDLMANGGHIRFTAFADGRIRTWVDFGDLVEGWDEWDALGTIEGQKLTTTPAESIRPVKTYTFSFEDEQLTLINENDVFDFTLTGNNPVAATSKLVFIRN